MKYLLDTNLVSELIKPDPDPGVIKRSRRYKNELGIAAPVWHELWFGCYRMPHSRKREMLELFLEEVVRKNLSVIPYDERAARWQAIERARLTLAGNTPSFVDGQIAAIAVTNSLILVTRNTSDFRMFSGLKLESWHTRPVG
jgi:tRNA(fMet)-specific endonuclease VapC